MTLNHVDAEIGKCEGFGRNEWLTMRMRTMLQDVI